MNVAGDLPLEDSLACVVTHLPGRASAITAEFERSESFRGLCEDFQVCAEAVAEWQAQEGPAAVERRREYAESLAELEQEILGWISEENAEKSSRLP
ncbi:MAG: hypothetical protein PVI87_04665 [Gammaproteobacteria bacterium]|jgi:hypothetical protein